MSETTITAEPQESPVQAERQAPPPVQQPQPAPEPKAPAKPAPVAADRYNFDTSGSRSLDGALRIIGRAGIPADNPAMEAAREGNFAPLRSLLEYVGAEDADIALELLEGAYNDWKGQAEKTQAETLKELQTIAGGSEQWDATLEFIEANATDEEAAELMAALDEGGAAARMAARYMSVLYQYNVDAVPAKEEPQAQAQQESVYNPYSSQGPNRNGMLDHATFMKQYREMLSQGLDDNSPAVRELQARRLSAIRAEKRS